jgi:integrase
MPMSNYLYGLFQRLQKLKTNEYVFPGAGKAGHLVEPRKQIDFITRHTTLILNGVANQDELDIKIAKDPDSIQQGISFMLHDLRRTFITIAESLDIPYAALKRLLNHIDGNDVTGGYLQITTDRLREPMERISTKLMELMGIPVIEGSAE